MRKQAIVNKNRYLQILIYNTYYRFTSTKIFKLSALKLLRYIKFKTSNFNFAKFFNLMDPSIALTS